MSDNQKTLAEVARMIAEADKPYFREEHFARLDGLLDLVGPPDYSNERASFWELLGTPAGIVIETVERKSRWKWPWQRGLVVVLGRVRIS